MQVCASLSIPLFCSPPHTHTNPPPLHNDLHCDCDCECECDKPNKALTERRQPGNVDWRGKRGGGFVSISSRTYTGQNDTGMD